jgi:hypothetical protein
MPITLRPISVARYTTDLITEFKPGTSPPPVKTAILVLAVMNQLLLMGSRCPNNIKIDSTTLCRTACSIAIVAQAPQDAGVAARKFMA